MAHDDIRDLTIAPGAAPENEQALGLSSRLLDEIAAARGYRAKSKAANTLRAYQSDWKQFEAWCDERGLEPLPARPEAVATYLAALATAGRADSTITRHCAAIAWKHGQEGLVAPQVRDGRRVIVDTLAGIRREQRARPTARKAAITATQLSAMMGAAAGEGSRAVRDRAILALGLAAALRRSELVALQLDDVDFEDRGLKLTLRHSKTDQDGEGQVIAVPVGKVLAPVARLQAWLAVRDRQPGPLFYQIEGRAWKVR